jgi:hypothetical protein
MKPLVASIITPLLLFVVTTAFAIESPRVVPRMQQIQKPADEVFENLKNFFSDSARSNFTLVSADRRTHTLVARQSGIDDGRWSQWAYCETGPVQMIYKLADGAVTVTVKVNKSTPHDSFASVAADFQGTYNLGSNENKVACTSRFVLEDNILAAAGAAPGK